MISRILFMLCLMGGFYSSAQHINLEDYRMSPEKQPVYERWLKDLYEMGVQVQGDSIVLNVEAKYILQDTNYYKIIYPSAYHWQSVEVLMKRMALKPALWYMINLFQQDDPITKDLVLNTIVTFDQMFEMDKVLISTLYTYIRFDPMVTTVKGGQAMEVQRPDIAEQKMLTTKEMVGYVLAHRANQQKR
ncbi:MAG: hypothetical protein KTR30_38525 [Saprospiraceae bacterium]|nr:hypothetical protein [Saprospiraceae bacterium]